MLRNDIVDLYHCLYGRRKPPCLSGAMYQRVAEAPPTALESAEIPGLSSHVSPGFFFEKLHFLFISMIYRIVSRKWIWKSVSKDPDSVRTECPSHRLKLLPHQRSLTISFFSKKS